MSIARWVLACGVWLAAASVWGAERWPSVEMPDFQVAKGAFQPNWESLRKGYKCPQWFRDAKFGIWAHWGPQCVVEVGGWYSREMYMEGSWCYKYHLAHYGHPSVFGFKDICNLWKAEEWRPEQLLALYKRAGARYFVAMAAFHDNFDAWNSKYQPWNTVRVGPKRDVIGLWAAAARKEGLPFGVTYHVSPGRVWRQFMPVRFTSDKQGPQAGVPYDALRLTKADGKGTWWEGLDPRDFYGPPHAAEAPCPEFVQQFLLRVDDLVRQHHPDLLYFDDCVNFEPDVGTFLGLPDLGPQIAANYYNLNAAWHGGHLQGVFNLKLVPAHVRDALVEDFEKGRAAEIRPHPWQTDTCLVGTWHYERGCHYRSAESVIHELVDIVSKNGNMLLNVPLPARGSIDPAAVATLEQIGAWLRLNGEAIYGTRPWEQFGEDPPKAPTAPAVAGPSVPVRFTTHGKTLYAILLGWPKDRVTLASLAAGSPHWPGAIRSVRMLGADEPLQFTRDGQGLTVELPPRKPCQHAWALKIAE